MDIEKMIEDLDTAAGMLIVAAMKDPLIKDAMNKISNVSFQLGQMAADEEL